MPEGAHDSNRAALTNTVVNRPDRSRALLREVSCLNASLSALRTAEEQPEVIRPA